MLSLECFTADIHGQNPDADNSLMDEDLEACPSSQESNKSTMQENPKPLNAVKVNSKISNQWEGWQEGSTGAGRQEGHAAIVQLG